MTTQRNTFQKNERLCSNKIIQRLFDEGQSFVRYPFRITILPIDDEDAAPLQILISVSKKRFKRANKRNWVKRRIREAYRLNKHQALAVLTEKNIKLAVSFVYLPSEVLDYSNIEKTVKKALKQIVSKVVPDENH
ncbi:ribonuclease P protein component [Carboxylicivirga caseinilyticus]|uniref:ribonuclease P protein component n=1 Tax=Carboxylicivirga caseinilyticus TaxID=3417572 RepID=UPI003D32B0AD|nr:ribonuclease P protein component [Marinilabiliaceae bacterium A049]